MISTESVQIAVNGLLEAKAKPYPQHVNRISSLDYPCERQLFYQRTAWDQAAPRSPAFQGVLETGTTLEPVIERILSEIGEAHDPPFRIVGQQTTTNDRLLKQYQISGTIDGFLQVRRPVNERGAVGNLAWSGWETVSVCDIKTSNPNVFRSLDGYESLGRYSWTRAYRGQLSLYALAHNLEQCTLIFVNKANLYEVKIIHFPLDMAYCERLLQKAERINLAVEMNEPPEGINDPDKCPECPFLAYCCPSYSTGGKLQVVDEPELEAILDRLGELSGASEEVKDLEKQRDLLLVKGQDIAVGQWLVVWKQTANGSWKKSITGAFV